MRDKVSKKDVKEVVNEVLADAVWGSVSDGQWVAEVTTPSVHRPSLDGVDVTSYCEWLAQKYPGRENKQIRSQKAGVFTDEGEPGVAFCQIAQDFVNKLKNPDGSPVQIIPAFFELLLHLKQQKRSFSILFRTFGDDLGDIVEEFNMFCEGKHPLYLGSRMDGSDGETDYRVKSGDPAQCGIFYRDDLTLAIVMGTWESPEKEQEPSLKFYDSIPGAKVKQCTLQELHDFVRNICVRPGTMALRDYFPYWKTKEMQPDGGKLFFYELHPDAKEHWMFFDDNIRYNNAYIIDARLLNLDNKVPFVSALLQSHIVRAEPLESIGDEHYFVKQVAALEAGYDRRLRARQRLQKYLRLVRTLSTRLSTVRIPELEYDAWKGKRVDNQLLSLGADEDIEP